MSSAKTAAQQLAQEILRLKERSRVEKDRHKQKRQHLEQLAMQQSQEMAQLREQLRSMEFQQQKQLDEFEAQGREQESVLEQIKGELAREKEARQSETAPTAPTAPAVPAPTATAPPAAMRTMVASLQKRLHDANSQIASLEEDFGRTKVELAEARDATASARRDVAEVKEHSKRQTEGAASQILELQDTITELKNERMTELDSHRLEQERLRAQCKSLEKDMMSLMAESDREMENLRAEVQAAAHEKIAQISELTQKCQTFEARCADLSSALLEAKGAAQNQARELQDANAFAHQQLQRTAELEKQTQAHQGELLRLTDQHNAVEAESSKLRDLNERLRNDSLSLQRQVDATKQLHLQAVQQIQEQQRVAVEAAAQHQAVTLEASAAFASATSAAAMLEQSRRQSVVLQQELDSVQTAQAAEEASAREAYTAAEVLQSQVDTIQSALRQEQAAKSSAEAQQQATANDAQMLRAELYSARATAGAAANTQKLLQEELVSMQAALARETHAAEAAVEEAKHSHSVASAAATEATAGASAAASTDVSIAEEAWSKRLVDAEETIARLHVHLSEKDAEVQSQAQMFQQYEQRVGAIQSKYKEQEQRLEGFIDLQAVHDDLKNQHKAALEAHAAELVKVAASEHLAGHALLERAVLEEAEKGQRVLADARDTWVQAEANAFQKVRDEATAAIMTAQAASSGHLHEMEVMQAETFAQMKIMEESNAALTIRAEHAGKKESLLRAEVLASADRRVLAAEHEAKAVVSEQSDTLRVKAAALAAAHAQNASMEADIACRQQEERRLRTLLEAAQNEASRLVDLAGKANQEINGYQP